MGSSKAKAQVSRVHGEQTRGTGRRCCRPPFWELSRRRKTQKGRSSRTAGWEERPSPAHTPPALDSYPQDPQQRLQRAATKLKRANSLLNVQHTPEGAGDHVDDAGFTGQEEALTPLQDKNDGEP